MADLRQELIDAGWEQGVVLDPGCIEESSAVGYLVLNQTCDCINPSFEKEPHLELLPLHKRQTKKGNPDPNCENGKNPREIHFWVTLDGEPLCVEARIREIQLVDRRGHPDFSFLESVKIPPAAINDILAWRAARYLRAAFPDSFENAFRSIKDQMTELLAGDGMDQLVDSILIKLDHYDELVEEGDAYDVKLRLMITPAVKGRSSEVEKVRDLADRIQELFRSLDEFPEADCQVVDLREMSLWESRKFLDFTRFDYLSFGEDDQG